ncbi:MAG: EAL domain-containing protein [Sterolibacterium sp.]|nr:EAL domain-containing protein [Sterolibacterium sp.]
MPPPVSADQTSSPDTRRFVRHLWLGVLVLNLLVAAFAAQAIYSSWRNQIEHARTATQNLSMTLEGEIVGIFDNVDLALKNLVDDYADKCRSKAFPVEEWNVELRRQRLHLPILSGIRGTDTAGTVSYGLVKGDPQGTSVADRNYFVAHRDHPDAGLLISRPVFSRITHQWSLVLSRRLNDGNGRFGGIIAATIPLERFSERFTTLKVGDHGSIGMRDGNLRLIVRYPQLAHDGEIGSTRIADEFTAALQRTRTSGSYQAGVSSIDGIQRFHSYRRNGTYDFYINVGVAKDEYLTPWHDELIQTGAMACFFLLVTVLFARKLQQGWISQQAAAAQLSKVEGKYRLLFEQANDGIFLQDETGFIDCNQHGASMYGLTKEQVIGRSPADLCPERQADGQLSAKVAAEKIAAAFSGEKPCFEWRALRADSVPLDVEVSLSPVEVDGGTYLQAIVRDISERKLTEQYLRVAATAFESQEGMLITDAARTILRVNRAFSEITGYSAEDAVGKTPHLLKSGRHDAAFYDVMTESLLRRGTWQGEIWNRRKNGEVYPEWLIITAVKDDSGEIANYVATLTDITARKTAEDEIRHLAFYDPLTRLPNRRLLLDRLQQALASSSRSERYGALLFIDLDNFKTLNDTLGHDIGDLLLQQVAQRIATCVREGDTVARLGGDEFVVMLEDLSEHPLEAATQAEIVGEKILGAFRLAFQLANYEHHSTPSIGVTLFTNHQGSIDELLKRADLAMYQAKASGRNTLRFFDPEMQAVVTTRAALEADLHEAVLKDQFLLYYQAQVDGEGCLTGVEALLRWQHPERGLVSPLEFIPLAEETGLILPLGHWVLETACVQLALWSARPEMAHLTVAVNVSARQFRHYDFVDQVLEVLARTGANPQRLKLELTESLLLDDVEDVIAKMAALKVQGVGFALDDFGTGYSSLSYLKRLPLDQLKIDQGFVRDILIDPNDAAIAKMVVALAKSLGLAVIAEGVEIEAQMDFLARQGCHAYQGYLFSHPLPLAEFEEYAKRSGR